MSVGNAPVFHVDNIKVNLNSSVVNSDNNFNICIMAMKSEIYLSFNESVFHWNDKYHKLQ